VAAKAAADLVIAVVSAVLQACFSSTMISEMSPKFVKTAL
jgi:hypothetical protein